MANSIQYMCCMLLFVSLSCCREFYVEVLPTNHNMDDRSTRTLTTCGGAWIDQKFVVTTASCFDDNGNIKIKEWESVWATVVVPRDRSLKYAAVGFRQEGYNRKRGFRMDLALLKLMEAVPNFPSVRICDEGESGTKLVVVGSFFPGAAAPGSEADVEDETPFYKSSQEYRRWRQPLSEELQILLRPSPGVLISDKDTGSPVIATKWAKFCKSSCAYKKFSCLKGIVSHTILAGVVASRLSAFKDLIKTAQFYLLKKFPNEWDQMGRMVTLPKKPNEKTPMLRGFWSREKKLLQSIPSMPELRRQRSRDALGEGTSSGAASASSDMLFNRVPDDAQTVASAEAKEMRKLGASANRFEYLEPAAWSDQEGIAGSTSRESPR